MPRRREKTIGTVIACVLLPSAHALSGEPSWRPADRLPFVTAEIAPAERLLTVGTTALAVDGTVVGKVSGLSRDPHGHVTRIRVTSSMPSGSEQTILIIRDTYFNVTDQAVQLKLTIAGDGERLCEQGRRGSVEPSCGEVGQGERRGPLQRHC
jgi:hypothetical protein